jgi:hypothetical protein
MASTQTKDTDDKPKRPRDPSKPEPASDQHPAGPHARPGLTDADKTPGSGMFPSEDGQGGAHVPPTG